MGELSRHAGAGGIDRHHAGLLARLLAGVPVPDEALTALPEGLAAVAARVAHAAGGDRVAALDRALAGWPDADAVRAAIFAEDPADDATDTAPAPPASAGVWSHRDLLAAVFPPQRWVVDGLVPDEGLTILGGKKKLGKSWLALQITQAVAAGRPVLGRATTAGAVIYLCLEDGARRLQDRLRRQRAPADLPITYVTKYRPLDGDGLADLAALLAAEAPRLLIVDTLAAAKTGRTDENDNGTMADLFNALRDLARDARVGILVVAHHGKAAGGDPGHDVRGASAAAAAADQNLGLYKVDGHYLLKGEGRDVAEFELRVHFDPTDTWCWHLDGDARQLARDEAEATILAALDDLGEVDVAAIAAAVGKDRTTAQRHLQRLREGGRVTWRTVQAGQTTKLLYRRAEPDEAQRGRPDR
ncbi:MAG TPA: AAA family ATPase [Thermomicrobiales bacterium]|nr:AAA family ATPase [Thermomicrobiales bacterium]